MPALMSASPALWTARVILAAALGVGIASVWTHRVPGPASHAVPAIYREPHPVASARPGASFPLPGPSPTAAPRPTPGPIATVTAEPLAIRRVLDTGGPIRYGAWFWDEAGVPDGQIIITVDLKANILSIFRAGYEIGTAAIIYGADEKPTPLGTFPILQKDANHISNLYGAKMPYALRLTGDGVFIHSSKVAFDAATHGCIGVPHAFARKLFGAVQLGDRVIVTRG